MGHPNTKLPTRKTVEKDFEKGTVQPGPGMAPEKAPAEDMKEPGASEEFDLPGSAGEKKDKPSQQR